MDTHVFLGIAFLDDSILFSIKDISFLATLTSYGYRTVLLLQETNARPMHLSLLADPASQHPLDEVYGSTVF